MFINHLHRLVSLAQPNEVSRISAQLENDINLSKIH